MVSLNLIASQREVIFPQSLIHDCVTRASSRQTALDPHTLSCIALPLNEGITTLFLLTVMQTKLELGRILPEAVMTCSETFSINRVRPGRCSFDTFWILKTLT